MNKPTCETCRYWHTDEHPQQDGEVQNGECRIKSPAIVAGQSEHLARLLLYPPELVDSRSYADAVIEDAQQALWPVTRDWDWCGEHKPNQKGKRGEQ